MVKSWQKRIDRLDPALGKKLESVIVDVLDGKLADYDVKKIVGQDSYYRIRVWKIRIVFQKDGIENRVMNVDFRWNIYKDL